MTESDKAPRNAPRGHPADAPPRIHEICDQLHRLEALISVTLPVPMACGSREAKPPFVFFRQLFEPSRR
jgi:hypothetical protein